MENMEYPKMVMQPTVIGLILLTICVIVMAHLERKFREMLKPKHNSKAKPLADKKPEATCETEKKDWAIIENCDMSGYNFERKTYTNTYFINVNFTGSNFKNATFMHCNFVNCNMNSAQILNTEIYDCVIKGCNLMTANFDSSNFTACTFDFCTSDENWPVENVKFVDCEGEFLTATYCITGINGEISIIDNGSEFRDCDLTGSELRVKSLLIVNSHKGIDIVNGTL